MFVFLFVAVLCTGCLAVPMMHYSYSPSVGGGSGTSFSTEGGYGKITAIRVWELNNAYIVGIQLRYGGIWTERAGREIGVPEELELFDGETIVQVSGKYHSNYIYQLKFVTSRGRILFAGQPLYASFNFYASHPDAELKLLSGRSDGSGITALGAHWGVHEEESNTTDV
uniref:Jacalin-type lectin domain-containing protein n=1 Tax=Gasterosteus aculeatus aculeatus TaxID=481459 RepID=G3NRN3_GASAC|nr:zymogen granule membrane protein 16-like [Gasterosteus aculeatus aculeatus]